MSDRIELTYNPPKEVICGECERIIEINEVIIWDSGSRICPDCYRKLQREYEE